VITWNGAVVPCCFDKDAKHVMGDLKQKTLKEIWANNSYKDFRLKLSKGRNEIDICNNCTEGCKVWS
jgi:radical SAM protein with 4Fe4S-binding SPASM domain